LTRPAQYVQKAIATAPISAHYRGITKRITPISTRVFIHAGAHRTGTSSFQQMLALNYDALQNAGYGLAYPGRDGAQKGRLRLKLPNPRDGDGENNNFVKGARRQINRLNDGKEALVLSEENIPGRMFHFYYGKFFPAAHARASVLKRALPGPLAHLLYVVRPYDQIYTSGFRKRAEDNAVEEFATLRPNMMAISDGWPDLIKMFQQVLQPEKLTIIDYAARGRSVDLLGHLLGRALPDLQEPAHKVNQSATDAALTALQTLYRAGKPLERDEWAAIIKSHADAPQIAEFAAFSDAERQILGQKYARDLDEIAKIQGVHLIRA